MRITEMKDYADDDNTQTLHIISAVTSEGCVVSEREFEYEDEDENSKTFGQTLIGIEMILQTASIEDQVLRTLEELAEEVTADELSLVEN